ncbi:XdhC family protein [Pseudomonas eucalypticola]|uniref:XdhC family protein n=1 Tax=Pseudomonas eucalypticola TaxID=2599595 RepID=A0A7D5D7E9_9PSED|nr:XdhC family protein [Pseudomonas eucalypticola]QKZ04616.1 XdhC family protein [Pseudomonas eucalypticola]
MQHLDLQVVQQALDWLQQDQPIWLSTVLSTYGSAPREPGAMLVARGDGAHCGSLSGGCVEEDFIARLAEGRFAQPQQLIRYGAGGHPVAVALPCGGSLLVLVERLAPSPRTLQDMELMRRALLGEGAVVRRLDLAAQTSETCGHAGPSAKVILDDTHTRIQLHLGPAHKLLIAGLSPVAEFCAQFALTLGLEVVICDPRDEAWAGFALPGVTCRRELPAVYIENGGCHAHTAVVALTHDPRLDDLTMMEAVRTPAFYIGAMGSQRTSERRLERLRRIGRLSDQQLSRIRAPIGLNLGSKTPAQIALAVLADILRASNGIRRADL